MSKIEELWITIGSTSEEITAAPQTVSFKMVFFPKYDDDDQITKGKICSICSMFMISVMCICRLNGKSSED